MFAGSKSNFSQRLPFQVALGALVLYGITLGHGVTMNSLSLTAKVAGWDWVPFTGQPLLWLLTLPCRLLPAAGVAWGLNFFAAATAALTLGLLARTVQLLPWDRPFAPGRPVAGALPVWLACVACGLEFSFWQEATAASGEMLDLLPLATALWLLLEYRVRRESRWLDAAVLVWGLGMAENWVMLLTLPLFVGGVIWVQGIYFLEKKFMLRLAGIGLVGFSLYALLPLVNGVAPHSPWNMGQAWVATLRQTKNMIVHLPRQLWQDRSLLLAVAIYLLVPSLSCLVRLRDEGTRNKLGVDRFQTWTYRCLRAALLVACLWLAFDPVNGPRQLVHRQLGLALPWLTFDYLNALGAAFLAGNFLLISQIPVPEFDPAPSRIPWPRLAVPVAVSALVLLMAGLAGRNGTAILRTNFRTLERFGEVALGSLPAAGGGVMISSEPQKLAAFQAALAHHRNRADWVAVDMRTLPLVAYRGWLEHRQPVGWLTDENRHELNELEAARLLAHFADSRRLFCVHPTYGHLFERFYAQPVGLVYEVKLRETNTLEIRPLTAAATAANETFWNGAWQQELAPLVPAPPPRPTFWQKRLQRYGATTAPVYQDRLLAEWYSRSLTGWGVALQREGRLSEARLRLGQALQLNTNNFSAQISLACNTNLEAGRKLEFSGVDQVESQLGDPQHLNLLLNEDGPFDDPVYDYLLGCAFQKAGMWLQAGEQFERSWTLAPDAVATQLALAEVYHPFQFADRAGPLISNLVDKTRNLPAGNPLRLEVLLLKAADYFVHTNRAQASDLLQSVLRQSSNDVQIANMVVRIYAMCGDFTNSLQILNLRLAKSPDEVTNLAQQAEIMLLSGKTAAAIPVLDHILTLTNLPDIRLTRALARLSVQGDLAAAETDIRELEKMGNQQGRSSYGRAIVAEHRHDTNQAAQYLRLFLTNTTPGTILWQNARARLQAIESSSKDR